MKVKTNLLPIGTVVKVKGYKNKVIITIRNAIICGKDFYDYAASIYPIGVHGKKRLYFQAEDIEKIYFKGYQDQEDIDYQKSLQEKYKDIGLKDLAKKDWPWKKRILHFFHLL